MKASVLRKFAGTNNAVSPSAVPLLNHVLCVLYPPHHQCAMCVLRCSKGSARLVALIAPSHKIALISGANESSVTRRGDPPSSPMTPPLPPPRGSAPSFPPPPGAEERRFLPGLTLIHWGSVNHFSVPWFLYVRSCEGRMLQRSSQSFFFRLCWIFFCTFWTYTTHKLLPYFSI